MDLLQMVNMLVENDIPVHILPTISRECPGLNFVQRQRWWTPRHRGIDYASICDSCYARFRHEEDFKAIATANNCFCDGFLYGNLGGKQGPVNISFWKKSLKEYYPITESGVEIPAESPFVIGIHVSLNEGQYYKYEIVVDDQVFIPYGEMYHYQLSLASTGGTGGAGGPTQFHIVPMNGHWQHFPRSFLINNMLIPDDSKITVNIKLFESRKRKYRNASDEFVGYYTYQRDEVSVIAALKGDAPENASMVSIKTNHLTNTTLKIPHITMQPMVMQRSVIANFKLRAIVCEDDIAVSKLFTETLRFYRDAVTRRIRFMEVKGIVDDDAVAQMKSTLAKLHSTMEMEDDDAVAQMKSTLAKLPSTMEMEEVD